MLQQVTVASCGIHAAQVHAPPVPGGGKPKVWLPARQALPILGHLPQDKACGRDTLRIEEGKLRYIMG